MWAGGSAPEAVQGRWQRLPVAEPGQEAEEAAEAAGCGHAVWGEDPRDPRQGAGGAAARAPRRGGDGVVVGLGAAPRWWLRARLLGSRHAPPAASQIAMGRRRAARIAGAYALSRVSFRARRLLTTAADNRTTARSVVPRLRAR